MLPDPDPEVLRRFQEGDASAFEALVRRYEGSVLSLARRYLGSRSPGVDDVAQAVFVRIWRARKTWEPRAKVGTWIYRIAVNACLNEIRRLRADKNRRVASFTAVFGGDADEAEGADVSRGPAAAMPEASDAMVGGERAARVRAAVDALPEQQRLALVLSRFHGCSHEDVAAATGSSVPAVKSLLTRARENLRRALADYVSDPEVSDPEVSDPEVSDPEVSDPEGRGARAATPDRPPAVESARSEGPRPVRAQGKHDR